MVIANCFFAIIWERLLRKSKMENTKKKEVSKPTRGRDTIANSVTGSSNTVCSPTKDESGNMLAEDKSTGDTNASRMKSKGDHGVPSEPFGDKFPLLQTPARDKTSFWTEPRMKNKGDHGEPSEARSP
jgi:hypothetical protein